MLVIFVRAFVFQQSEIPSGSMEDTVLIGDYVLVNRFSYAPALFDWERRWLPIGPLRRGDVVVFKHPKDSETDYIKRVVGLPGESVELIDGALVVDGRPIAEPYLNELYVTRESFGPVDVAPGHYFLLGDHRNRSSDSRSWGLAPGELIKGRAFMILFSTSAAPEPSEPPGRVTPGAIVRKLRNLLFHSRWDRFFSAIR